MYQHLGKVIESLIFARYGNLRKGIFSMCNPNYTSCLLQHADLENTISSTRSYTLS
jgi:hypothetical protein